MFGDHTRNVKLINFPFIIGADGTKFFKPIIFDVVFLFYWMLFTADSLQNKGYARHYALLKAIPFPLPPLAEQKRIVERLQELEPMLDSYNRLEQEESRLVSELPDRLRKSILQYAIQGKLVPQDPNDEPASVLLERIRAEKEILIKQGKIKRDKTNSYIYRGADNSYYAKNKNNEYPIDEILFELPPNWTLCTISELCSVITDGTHQTPKYVNKGVPFLSVQNISSGKFDLTKLKYITAFEHNQLISRCKPENGDILLCRIGTLGKPIVVDLPFEFSIFVSLALLKILNKDLVDYIKLVLESPFILQYINIVKVGGGTHTAKINVEDLSTFPIPLPPLAEQRRIADAVRNAMELINLTK